MLSRMFVRVIVFGELDDRIEDVSNILTALDFPCGEVAGLSGNFCDRSHIDIGINVDEKLVLYVEVIRKLRDISISSPYVVCII